MLVADKNGDVYRVKSEVAGDDNVPRLLLGHLSQLLDMTLDHQAERVITADRDEKIRVSRYPNSYNIENYCLGHTEFVTTVWLSRVSSDVVISGSGDGTVRLWNYKTGEQLLSHDVTEDMTPEDRAAAVTSDNTDDNMETEDDSLARRVSPPSTPAVVKIRSVKISSCSEMMIVQVENCSTLLCYTVMENSRIMFDSRVKPDSCLLDFDMSDDMRELLILRKTESAASVDTHQILTNTWSKVGHWSLDSQQEFFTPIINYESEGMNHLHKRWFDNVKEYFDRKEARIEKNKNKSKDAAVPEKKQKCET